MSTIRIVICPHCNRGNTIRLQATRSVSYRMCEACGQIVPGPEKAYEYRRRTISHYQITYDVIEVIVQMYFGAIDYSFVELQESGNDIYHKFDVTDVIERWCADDAKMFRQGEGYGNLNNHDILNILCADGWLSPGTYLVEVCW